MMIMTKINHKNYSRSSVQEEDLPCWVLGLLLSGGWVVTCPHPRLHDGVPCSHVYTRVTSLMIQFPFPIIIMSRVNNSSLLWRSIFVTLIYHSRHMNITTRHVWYTCIICQLSTLNTRVSMTHVSLLADTRALTDNSTTAAGVEQTTSVLWCWSRDNTQQCAGGGAGVPSPLRMTPWQHEPDCTH